MGFLRNFPVTAGLLILWTVLYLYTVSRFGFGYNESLNQLVGIVPEFVAQGAYWRLLTYGYFHNGLVHFVSNAVFLYFFSPPLEKWLGHGFYLGIHFFTIIATGLAIYFSSNSTAVGASGFEYSLLGIYVYVSFFKRPLIHGTLRTVVLVLVLLGVISTFQVRLVSISGHLSGLVIGFLIAWFSSKRISHEYNPRPARS